jgi:putative transposase
MPANPAPARGQAASGPAAPDIFTPVTNLIESMNARLRKVTRNRGQFPSGQAALKVLCLAVRNLEDYRRPNVGIRSSGWKQALQAFTIYFEGRIPTP